MPQQHVQKGVGPRDGITAGVHEAGCGVQFDQDVQKWLKLAESSSSAPASAREASQQRIPSWPSLPALQAMRRTTDSAKRNSSAPAEGLEEGRQRGRSGLWQADPDEVEPPGGQEDGTPPLPHQLPRLTPRAATAARQRWVYPSDISQAAQRTRRPIRLRREEQRFTIPSSGKSALGLVERFMR